MTFIRFVLIVGFFCVAGNASAKNWQFAEPVGPEGVIEFADDRIVMSFACRTRADAGYDPDNLTWRIAGALVDEQVSAAVGDVVRIGLSLDGQARGEGPFLMSDAGELATSMPRKLPFLAAMRQAKEVAMVLGNDRTVSIPLENLDSALDQLVTWCDRDVASEPEPDLAFDFCDAPEGGTAVAICSAPELRALETEMNAVYRTRLATLDERARAQLEKEQTSWTDFRKNCAESTDCISKATRARISKLTVVKADKPVRVAVQTRPKPPQALSVPLTPLQPAELGQVIWDPKQVQVKLIIEVVRARPEMLQNESVLRAWARLVFEGQSQGQDGQLAVARDHLTRSISANPPGPFLIGRVEGNPLQSAQYEGGKLKVQGGGQSQALGAANLMISGVATIEQRAISQFDVSELAMNNEQAAYIQQKSPQLSLGVVTQIDGIEVHGSSQTNARAVARGQVRFAGLFDKPQARGQTIDHTRLVAVFLAQLATTPENGIAGVAMLLGIGMHQGAVIEGQSYDPSGRSANAAAQLMRLANLKANAPAQLEDQLRAEVFFQLATQQERDAVIPPHYFGQYGRNNSFAFDQSVDEFERAELLARVDKMLWPVVRARLPNFPIDVIARIPVNLGEYDHSNGGFTINSSGVGALGIAAQGQYPAFGGLPDFLPSPLEPARQLVAYLENKFGPGNRQMTLVARYRVTGARIQRQQNRKTEVLLPIIEPQSISLHAYNQRTPDPDPMGQKVKEFDLAAYRGPERPVADPERVKFWADVRGGSYSTSDEVVAATLKLMATPDYLAHLVQNSSEVRSAGQFDRLQVEQDMRARLASLPMPEVLKLTGQVSLGEYDVPNQVFPVEGLDFRYQRGEIGIQSPAVQLVTPELFGRLQVDVETAKSLLLQDRNRGNSVPFVVWAKPSIANFDGRRGTLYIEPERIVFYSAAEDGTGYPAAYVEITPEAAQDGAVAATDLASVALQAPSQIALDSDYLDLLMIREASDDISEATWTRMMYDRMLREQVARGSGYPLAWGWFFPPGVSQIDPIRVQAMLERFRDWSIARAAALPDEVFVQQHSGYIDGGFQCWSSFTPPVRDFERTVPPELVMHLNKSEHSAYMQMLQIYQQRVRGAGVRQMPDLRYSVFGSPALASSNRVGSVNCNISSRNRLKIAPEQMSGMQTDTAMITVRGAIRKPLVQTQEARVVRDVGMAAIERGTDGVLQVFVDVTRSEVYTLGEDPQTGRIALEIVDTLVAEDLPAPPLSSDIFEITPGMDWQQALQSAQRRLPEAMVVENVGAPANFQMTSNNALLGPMAQFQAYHNGHFLFSRSGNEALAVMREPDRDPDRVLAVGSHRVFEPDKVTTDALVGALLRKYGASPETVEDGGLYGPRPAQVLTWGARAGCMPQMRDQLRADLTAFNQDPNFQLLSRMAKAFRSPQMQYNGAEQLIYETCAPAVWAMVGEDQQRRVHLVVWSLDLALLHEVAGLEDTRPKIDGSEGSQSLIEKAADIDL
ncbi:lysozyme inhibitor LprI family protein [Roseobacter sp. EG26]|uniref:lysozyme inhibitor LprI family protein n=1 Tax=Roseobacter sp. EG26 TaxID=3412477 RepID=UPI003CE5B6A3